ncbi:MAG: tetrahydrofolate synthase [Prevotella salivae]|nr:tetrahydrofolate synthase [Segatella salivae]
MNVFVIMNVVIVQRRRCYINVPMDVSAILNVITTQSHRRYINIPMNVSPILNVITTQLGTSCSFDSPGLARNEPTPGKRLQGDSTP